jgi:putative ABC transport system ATP-binding protein
MAFIEGRKLAKRYGSGEAAVMAIRDMTFQIDEGEFVAVMGESGAGKSTLLSVIGAMNAPTSGTFKVDGIDVYRLGQEQRADFRREFLGFVFQSFHLVPYLTVAENVSLPLVTVKSSNRKKRESALEALSRVGLKDKADRLPNQLSGGEKERVAIARATVNRPPLLLADEPTGNLDSRTSREIMELIRELNEGGSTIVVVTHSHDCAAYARRFLEVSDGRLTERKDLRAAAAACA